MKRILTVFSVAAFGCALPLSAQVTETKTESTTTTSGAGGTVTETSKSSVTTFTPEVRTKVVQYFDAHKAAPHGLPPAFVKRIQVKEIPATWRTERVAPGVVISEKERRYLVEAPPELIQVLPESVEGVRYYVAGSNVVAVNKSYKVVDSVRIPTVKLEPAPAAVETVEEVETVEVTPAPAPVPPPVQEVQTVEETTVEVRR